MKLLQLSVALLALNTAKGGGNDADGVAADVRRRVSLSTVPLLVARVLPDATLRTNNPSGLITLVSGTGAILDLANATQENPAPTNNVIGYWFSPAMDFLSLQKPVAANPDQATEIVRLYHALWRGPQFVQQKIYSARPIDVGWLVEVDHDFTNYPGSVQDIPPYELMVDTTHHLLRLTQRCYHYRGNASVYTNTILSVYEQEIKTNHGLNYPEALDAALQEAWKKERAKRP